MTTPFDELTSLQRNKLYNLLGVHIYKYKKNEEILPTLKSGNIIGIIMDGLAQINYLEYNGNEIMMETKIIIGRYGQEGVDSQLLITIGANEVASIIQKL